MAYLTVVARKGRRIDEVVEMASKCEALSQLACASEYTATSLANLAWAAWRRGDCEEAVRLGCEALGVWDDRVEGGEQVPAVWLGLWPLVAGLVSLGRIEQAVAQACRLLEAGVMRMPPELESSVEDLVRWDGRDPREADELLRKSIEVAERTDWL